MNPADLLKRREQILDAVRTFLKSEGLVEVETPALVPSPGLEPHLDPFVVRSPSDRPDVFLPTSPEYAMKKLLAAGSGSIFQICKAFRDEPLNEHHLPEFTMLEWYRVGCDYGALMTDCERLLEFVTRTLGGPEIAWQGTRVNLAAPFERLSVREAFGRHAGVDLTFAEPLDEIRDRAVDAGCVDVTVSDDWEEVFFKMFLRFVEPKLGRGRPTILFDYPASMAALSRIRRDDPLVCERFELYAGGLELANAFTELTDPVEQSRRLEADNVRRRELGKAELPIDEEFLAALGHGLPDCAGIALGLDRLIMLLTDTPDIRDVTSFGRGRLF